MPALAPGATAPDISLSTLDGRQLSLDGAESSTPVVAAFFKVGCPTCQYAFPFLERIYKAYPKDKVRVIGVSQDTKEDTAEFTKKFGVTFPVVLDEMKKYPASNAFGLTNVPSIFIVEPNKKIGFSSVGWVKNEIEALNKVVAQAAGVPEAQIFNKGEDVLDFKAG
ncbi:MAG: Peroxiredoxin-like protein [Acidobacteriales bacterium]|nr:Peroxiredoxin-like protein [Terriglobales bacterium]